jgi:prophage tail gpP-like protein
MTTERVTLRVNGAEYEGWTSIRVSTDVEQTATSFDLELTERWREPRAGETGGITEIAQGVRMGDDCEVRIGGTLVCTGYVDKLEKSYGPQEHRVSVSGRSKTGDLVDSSIEKDQQIKGKKLEDIARQLCAPHGIDVTVEADTGPPIEEFHAKTGETVHGELTRLCALRSLLVSDGPGGNLVITGSGAGGGRAEIRLGTSPIRTGSVQWDQSDRYGKTIVRGQQPLGGSGLLDGTAVALSEGVATDPAVKSARVKVITAKGRITSAEAQKRAAHDSRKRKGKGNNIKYELTGWRHPGGGLWWKGMTVRVEDSFLGLSDDYRVRGVELSLSEQGTVATVTLVDPAAYSEIGTKDGTAKPLGELLEGAETKPEGVGGMALTQDRGV